MESTRPPSTLKELESRERRKRSGCQFSMFKLVLATNVLGAMVAATVVTKGNFLLVMIATAAISTLLFPLLVFGYIWVRSILESVGWLNPKPFESKKDGEQSPFDD